MEWMRAVASCLHLRVFCPAPLRPNARSNEREIMSQLFRLPSSIKRDPSIDMWMRQHAGELGDIAKYWFEIMRKCGGDVREVLHDGHPTVCVDDAAFAYI